MGGSSAQAETGVQPSTLQNVNVPAFMPGQQGLLAQQLNAGFGNGQASGILSMQDYLNGMYKPMTVPLIQNAADMAALKAKLDKKTTTSTASGAATGGTATGGAGGAGGWLFGAGVR